MELSEQTGRTTESLHSAEGRGAKMAEKSISWFAIFISANVMSQFLGVPFSGLSLNPLQLCPNVN